jgi:ABC-type transport system substrate-binding protein
MIGQIFEGLTRWDDDLTTVPALAQSWSTSDAQDWTFQLRPGVTFHNGRPLTARDVTYSWDRVAAAGNDWYDYLVAPLLISVTTVGTDTVEVHLAEPYATFPSILALPPMSIVPSETVGAIVTSPVGAGPFQFQAWTPADSIDLVYFAGYHSGRPYLDGITYRFYADEAAMYDDYLLGNLDLSPVPSARISEVVGSPDAIWGNQLAVSAFWMKTDWPPFDDVRVRRGLNYAVDRQGLVDNVLAGYNLVAEGPVPPGMQNYDPPVANYAYSPTLALQLLADAGWTDTNADGILDDGGGNDLVVEMWYPEFPNEDVQAAAVAADLGDIGGLGLGVSVTISYTQWSTYLNNLDTYPMYRLGWRADFSDPYNFLYPLFHSAGSYAPGTHYQNPQVDAWLDTSLTTLDLNARQALYQAAETQVQEDAVAILLNHSGQVHVKSDQVIGLVIPAWGPGASLLSQVQFVFDTHDVQPESILYPKANTLPAPISPTLKVRNAGSSAEVSVPVRCRILDGAVEVYSQTVTLASLAPFASQVALFPAWTPSAAGDYTFEFTTLLPGDENPANDQEIVLIHVTDVAFYDAYTRDHATDDGSVPTQAWWQSPDIIVRNQFDNLRHHQDPLLGQTNYVYVQVRNVGNAAITDGYVDVYWHEPSTAVACGGWAPINATPIPVGSLAPGQSKWIVTPWLPPLEGHTCLFSRFWSSGDPVTAECDVPWDNNLAQRNVEVVSPASLRQVGQANALFEVTNLRQLPSTVDLLLEWQELPAGVDLVLEFGNDLFARWSSAGGALSGAEVVPGSTQIRITDPLSATIAGLPLGVRETQRVWLYLAGPADAEFELRISQLIDGQVVGGMTYHSRIPWTIYLPLVLRNRANRLWDPILDDLGVELVPASISPGQTHWRLVEARWADPVEANGDHTIYVEVLDEAGQRLIGQPLTVAWSSGSLTLSTESGGDWGANFPMYNTLGSYDVSIDGLPSDIITGLGLGTPEQPDFAVHTNFYLTFQRMP